mmetsp:Transcript_9239/g.22226  ORF Transcript_9239/g.22226 Transcript_9239/m.22226 type:complete len:291 (-) Transcript_9239:323-1195(-)
MQHWEAYGVQRLCLYVAALHEATQQPQLGDHTPATRSRHTFAESLPLPSQLRPLTPENLMLLPRRGLGIRELIQLPKIRHSLLLQVLPHLVHVREVLESVPPDGPPGQETAGAGLVRVLQDVLEVVPAGAGREHDPGAASTLAEVVEQGLNLCYLLLISLVWISNTLRQHRALQLEQVNPILRLGKLGDTIQNQVWPLLGVLHIVLRLRFRRVTGEGVHQHLENERKVKLLARLPNLPHVLLLESTDARIGVRPVPRQHLHSITSNCFDLLHAPVLNLSRFSPSRGFLED